MHKEMHRDGACKGQPEVPDVLNKNWKEYTKRIKPILMNLKEDFKKEIWEGIPLDGLTKLLESNTENILAQTKQMNEKWASMMNATKSEATSNPTATDNTSSKVTKLIKPAKVPSWTKDMSLWDICKTDCYMDRDQWRGSRVCQVPWSHGRTKEE